MMMLVVSMLLYSCGLLEAPAPSKNDPKIQIQNLRITMGADHVLVSGEAKNLKDTAVSVQINITLNGISGGTEVYFGMYTMREFSIKYPGVTEIRKVEIECL